MHAVLHDKRLKTISRRHPWVYSGAIRRFEGKPGAGDLVSLFSEDGVFLARGMWNPTSSIRLRVLTWEDEPIDSPFWRRRLSQAIQRRGKIPAKGARRLVHAENDYLPGLIVDQYAEWVVLQALTIGMDQRKAEIGAILAGLLKPRGVYERSDGDARHREGLPDVTGVLWGEEPPALVEIEEGDYRFLVDIRAGHKTGFYLDQRENRQLLSEIVEQGAQVLNAFSYTAGFSLNAYGAGADYVLSVDASESVIGLADENLKLNGFDDAPLIAGDAFNILRELRDEGEEYDLIILDPPKFAKSNHQVDAALRGYKDINLLAMQMIREGGLLMTFSCSGAVSADLFRKVVFGALEDSGREAQVLRQLEAPPDHPVALTFPEGAYLKGLLLRIV